ncbi:hypothetical protein [Methanorbis furvi]|uniref:Uncharacterized protein n=1 Tax=Methanorbis furvi TaxID=3028299 RepID=A0AAE4SA43_9EURY|nr:hypothetical protein [Methanocorpusculaceae archaeon Ag1]
MEGENTGENQGKTSTSPEKRERVAVCLVCSNEWIARTGTAKKPAKCPVCGTKRCSWKDEVSTEPENQPVEQEKTVIFAGENEENKGEEQERTGEIEEKTEEKREEKREKQIYNPITEKSYSVKSRSSKAGTKGPIKGLWEEPEKTEEEKSPAGSFPIILVVAGLVVLGCLAGVGWFLGRRSDTRNRSVPADFRPPTAAERAMIRVGV